MRVPRGITPKDRRQVIQTAADDGCHVTITNGGHVRILTPKGPYFTGTTGSDARSLRSLRVDLRRRGVNI